MLACPADDPRAIPKGRWIVHLPMKDGKAVYLSFDIEIAGKAAGIIQISAEIFRLRIAAGGGIGKDRIDDVVCSPNIFNSYIHPLTDMWEQRCIDVHQITSDDERIQLADGIERVLQQFTSSFYREVDTLETVVLVSN